jgi:predicted nucleic acid-binding protein
MRVLVDTNILVRSVQRNHPLMRVARNALRTVYQQGNELYLTTQNIAEFGTSATGPHGATLVTRNTREFSRVAGLRVESWFD